MNTSHHFTVLCFAIAALCCILPAHSFSPALTSSTNARSLASTLQQMSSSDVDSFELEVMIPPSQSGLVAQIKLQPVLEGPSELVEVRYSLPFGLDVQPQNGLAVCTKNGAAGGEQVGDVLRLSSQWTMGLPRGNGIMTTAASFSGAIGWQCSLFDVAKASSWDEVLEALTSNTPTRTDEVLMIFERPLKE